MTSMSELSPLARLHTTLLQQTRPLGAPTARRSQTHRAPLYCAARRSRRRPRPALPPQLDWPDPWAETNWAQTESKCGDSVSTAQRNQGCEMRFAGCEALTRPNSMQVRTSVRTLDAPRSWHGFLLAHLACVACVACNTHYFSLSQASSDATHTWSESCPTCR